MRVTNGIPLGCSLLLPVDTVNSVQTLKAAQREPQGSSLQPVHETVCLSIQAATTHARAHKRKTMDM
jgi:hypothetical protein